MNGLNKTFRNYRWRKFFYVLSGIYAVIVILLVLVSYQVPEIYQNIEQQRAITIKEVLDDCIKTNEPSELTTALAQIKEDEAIDFAVVSENNFSYSTVPSLDFAALNDWIDERTLSYHGVYKIETQTADYQVWLAIYRMEPQAFFGKLIIFLMLSVMVLFAIVTLLMMMMFKNLVAPIKRLRDNIFKLKTYQLSAVSKEKEITEYDALSKELSEFTDDLQGKMDSIGVKYTTLEKELQANREQSIYKQRLVNAMIHDLKTPLSISNIQVEMARKELGMDAAPARLDKIVEKNAEMLDEIKEVLNLIHTNDIATNVKPEKLDMIKMIRETLRRFAPVFEQRDIQYSVESPRKLYVLMRAIELRQILYNVISNVSQYTDKGGEFELNIYDEAEEIIIEAYNDNADSQNIDFEHVFDLFYYTKANGNSDSTGVGMYTIKKMVDGYGGTCTFIPKDGGVSLSIYLPKKIVGVHDE
ncbi:sensor histidine kinase [Isobaculum melis]|uniref:histidine kinase n=1 Tax=Isobaculum melis TaxID=142588 RepID=A0A1H9UAK9_9LACT|nr:HAMP domain-containing sensor histidine kinase [Isobaculum melis]SES06486.1 Signal transduction histidine kinase [Isobaculum melis]